MRLWVPSPVGAYMELMFLSPIQCFSGPFPSSLSNNSEEEKKKEKEEEEEAGEEVVLDLSMELSLYI